MYFHDIVLYPANRKSRLKRATCFLPQREGGAAYNLSADDDVNAVGAHAERTRTQIVYVLAAIDSEVGSCVSVAAVIGLIDLADHSPSRSRDSDRSRWQITSRYTTQGQIEFHGDDSAPDVKGA
jgi:hypothetical protein